MPSPPTVAPDEAAELLESHHVAREAADRRLAANWFTPVVVGVLMFVSSWFFGVWDGGAVALFWLAVSPFALVAIRRYQFVQLRRSGAVRTKRAYAFLAGSFIAGCVLCGAAGAALGEPDALMYGPLFFVALAYAVVAWIDRSRQFAIWAVVIAALSAIAAYYTAGDPGSTFAIVIGARLVYEGFKERSERGA